MGGRNNAFLKAKKKMEKVGLEILLTLLYFVIIYMYIFFVLIFYFVFCSSLNDDVGDHPF
jgi:hypothetical protein